MRLLAHQEAVIPGHFPLIYFINKLITNDNKKRKNITSTNINATQNADLDR